MSVNARYQSFVGLRGSRIIEHRHDDDDAAAERRTAAARHQRGRIPHVGNPATIARRRQAETDADHR